MVKSRRLGKMQRIVVAAEFLKSQRCISRNVHAIGRKLLYFVDHADTTAPDEFESSATSTHGCHSYWTLLSVPAATLLLFSMNIIQMPNLLSKTYLLSKSINFDFY